jgi:hypothetical protein
MADHCVDIYGNHGTIVITCASEISQIIELWVNLSACCMGLKITASRIDNEYAATISVIFENKAKEEEKTLLLGKIFQMQQTAEAADRLGELEMFSKILIFEAKQLEYKIKKFDIHTKTQ